MTSKRQKDQILESLNLLDQSQAEKVLMFIKDLVYGSKQEVRYRLTKREAIKQIQQALRQIPA